MCIAFFIPVKFIFIALISFHMYFSFLYGTRVYLRILYDFPFWSNCLLYTKTKFSPPLEFSFSSSFFVEYQGTPGFKVIQEDFETETS